MLCNFCGSHTSIPKNGSQYTKNFISCHQCVLDCWKWVKSHTNKKPSTSSKAVATSLSFYEAAAIRLPENPIRELNPKLN